MRPRESLMNSEVSSDQQEEMIEKEDQKSILMIGGIQIFLPHSPVEARECVADAATTERQPAETVKEEEEVEQTLMFSQGEEDEHSKNGSKFSARKLNRKITAALETAEEEEEESRQHRFC
jgi:mannitol/fructose-specific phosphotransferase system IIA component